MTTATGARVPRIGLGCMGMSEFYGPPDDARSLQGLHRAYDLGYRHFDTADMYGSGHNENLLATFLRELGPTRRSSVFLATKVGLRRLPGEVAFDVDSSPAYVARATDASLTRLKVECVDLLYLHRRAVAVPIEDTMGAMGDLVRKGKARSVGLSEVSVDTLRQAHATFPVAAVQSEYSLWTRDVERDVLGACEALDIVFVAYSPLGRGFLTGTLAVEEVRRVGDLRGHLPRFVGTNFAANTRLLDGLREVSDEIGATMAQTALAWVLARHVFVHAIPGARSEAHLRSNLEAGAVVLSPQHVTRLSTCFHPTAAAGERLPEQLLRTVGT